MRKFVIQRPYIRLLMDSLKQTVCDIIKQESTELNEISKTIWNLKELSFEERLSHDCLTKFLEEKGFHVKRHYKLETAFIAWWGNYEAADSQGRKPHVAIMCEYDALPDIGHACGHNLIAEIALATGLAVKGALQQAGKELGKVSIIGTPAEEGGGGKIELLNAGVFDDVDVAMMSHPTSFTDPRPIFLGGKRFYVNYHGKASHAAGFPWDGVNALDAAVLGYMNVAALRQQLKPTWRVHAIITKGGTKTNIIPDETQMMLQVRAPSDSEVEEVYTKVKTSVTAAATATGCSVDITDIIKPYESLITNETLAKLYETNGALIGVEFPPVASKQILGSTDMGNVSHRVPSLHPTYNCGTQAVNHTKEFALASASPDAQPSTLAQAKILAMVALDIFLNPDLLSKIKQDFENDLHKV
ncbi:unnamed protein product [Lymnaea stagnalis]|uniref:Peptidase M20 domain-containing protein 2 n=1 Tax=Lymnaea stagnalis TaxID=6523 RepID=A0AAV2HPB5_LYMST